MDAEFLCYFCPSGFSPGCDGQLHASKALPRRGGGGAVSYEMFPDRPHQFTHRWREDGAASQKPDARQTAVMTLGDGAGGQPTAHQSPPPKVTPSLLN